MCPCSAALVAGGQNPPPVLNPPPPEPPCIPPPVRNPPPPEPPEEGADQPPPLQGPPPDHGPPPPAPAVPQGSCWRTRWRSNRSQNPSRDSVPRSRSPISTPTRAPSLNPQWSRRTPRLRISSRICAT